jgi:NADH-quinone oxidoreductase subunit J
MEVALFAVFAALAFGSAVVVVVHRNPVYSVLSLVVTLVSLAGLFVMLGAPFIAALQVLIYTGAILVLFLFVLMLLNVKREGVTLAGGRVQRWAASLCAAAFAGLLGVLLWRAYGEAPSTPLGEELVSLRTLARRLFGELLLPFEIVGLLLLAAVIGATVLARRSPGPSPGQSPGEVAAGEGEP